MTIWHAYWFSQKFFVYYSELCPYFFTMTLCHNKLYFFTPNSIFISITVCSGNISLDTSFDTCHSGMVIKFNTSGKAKWNKMSEIQNMFAKTLNTNPFLETDRTFGRILVFFAFLVEKRESKHGHETTFIKRVWAEKKSGECCMC